MAYVTLAEFKAWGAIDDTYDDLVLSTVLETAEREIEAIAGRKFSQDSVVSTRKFRPTDTYGRTLLLPPGADISTVTGLIVATDDNDDGTAETTWTITTDFQVEPFDGIGYDGSTGWPYTRIVGVGARRFWNIGRPVIHVTAKWGWPAVPGPVKHATLIAAHELWKMKDAPLGVAGFGDLGLIRVRENPVVRRLLARYMHPLIEAIVA